MTASTTAPRRARLWLWIAVAALACLAGALAGHWMFTSQAPADEAVETFFHTRLPDPAGTTLDFGAMRGKTVVINFWAPWCGPCVEEMPDLTAMHAQYQGKSVEFVGIGIDSATNIQAFLRKVPVAYPLAVAGFTGTELARSFGNAAGALPYTVVIGPDGAIRYRKLGRVTPAELKAVLPSA